MRTWEKPLPGFARWGMGEGWDCLFEGDDALQRSRLSINSDRRPDQIKVSYRTRQYADEGRPRFEAVAGTALVFRTREITDPKGMLSQARPGKNPKTVVRDEMPPEVIGGVKFLLHTYEHGEAQQAKAQQRPAVSYDMPIRLTQVITTCSGTVLSPSVAAFGYVSAGKPG